MSTGLQIPSYGQGHATCAAECEYPGLWRGLIGYWPMFLGPTFLTLHDWGGRRNDGALTGMVPANDWVPSPYGWALDFDGTNDYVLTTAPVITGATERTISSLVFCHTAKDGKFIGNGGGAGNGSSFDFTIEDVGGTKYVLFRHTGGNKRYPGVTLNTWHHIVVVVPRSATRTDDVLVYVDRLPRLGIQNAGSDQALNTAASNFAIGATATGGTPFDGLIAKTESWNRALTPNEIALLYADPFALSRLRRRVFPVAAPPAGQPTMLRWLNVPGMHNVLRSAG